MEESILKVTCLGFLPDIVVVRRSDGGGMDACCYVPQDLYEGVDAANREWQKDNRKLRELVRDMRLFILLASATEGVSIHANGKPTLGMEAFERRMRELGIEVDDD